MNQPEEWTNQRIALLRSHVQEWKDKAVRETQARNELVAEQQVEKDNLRPKANAVKWAHCITRQVQRLTDLASANQQQTQLLRMRQQQETDDLEALIQAKGLKTDE